MEIDDRSQPQLPSGLAVDAPPASFWRRAGAILVDVVLLSVAFECVSKVAEIIFRSDLAGFQTLLDDAVRGEIEITELFGIFCAALIALVLLLLAWSAYFIYFEFSRGATPGKLILGLRVVSTTGRPLTKWQAIYRDLVRWWIDILIFPAVISMALTRDRLRIGDVLAQTKVIGVKAKPDRSNETRAESPFEKQR